MKESPLEREARYKRLAALKDEHIDFSDAPDASDEELAQSVTVRGGVRPGAGRKRLGRVRVTLSLDPAVRQRLLSRAKKEDKTLSELIASLL